MKSGIDVPHRFAVWQYISLPRGPVGPGTGAGVHLENRILRGWTHQMCRIRADIEPFEMV